MRHQGRHLTPGRFDFGVLFGQLLRRLGMLTQFHTDVPLKTDFRALTAAAGAVPLVRQDLRWQDWTRYSSRQETTMQMGGLLGHFELDGGQALAPFWPCLWLGQWTHAGKGTALGLGAYRLSEPAPV